MRSAANAAMLPAYSFMLGLLGAAGLHWPSRSASTSCPNTPRDSRRFKANFAIPALLPFTPSPSWFVGIAFAAIGIGALVPAAIMSICGPQNPVSPANLSRVLPRPKATDRQESQMGQVGVADRQSFGALVFILFVPTQYAIQAAIAGAEFGIIQDAAFGRHRASIRVGSTLGALLIGWAVGTPWPEHPWAASVNFRRDVSAGDRRLDLPRPISRSSTLILNLIRGGGAHASVQRPLAPPGGRRDAGRSDYGHVTVARRCRWKGRSWASCRPGMERGRKSGIAVPHCAELIIGAALRARPVWGCGGLRGR